MNIVRKSARLMAYRRNLIKDNFDRVKRDMFFKYILKDGKTRPNWEDTGICDKCDHKAIAVSKCLACGHNHN